MCQRPANLLLSCKSPAQPGQRAPPLWTISEDPQKISKTSSPAKFVIERLCTFFLRIYSPNSSWAEWGSQFLLETAFVPSRFAGSSWFRLGFRCLSPFFSLLSFLRKGVLFHHGFPGSSCFGLGFRCLSPFFSLLSFLNRSVPDSSMNFELHMTLVETCVVAVWGLCWWILFVKC